MIQKLKHLPVLKLQAWFFGEGSFEEGFFGSQRDSQAKIDGLGCKIAHIRWIASISYLYTLPETNSSPLNMDGWRWNLLSGWPTFRGYVSFRERTT